jgi:hypothetical protein
VVCKALIGKRRYVRMAHPTQQSVLYPEPFSKPVVAQFDMPSASSDGGGVLLGALDRRLGLTEQLASDLHDNRDPSKVDHTYAELFRQRVFSIALGYPDCNDAARLATDPVLKELSGRSAVQGDPLASQPTLSRFENAPRGRELVSMGRSLEFSVIARHKRRRGRKVRKITIDLDVTDDPTHGQQQFTFFHGHYDTWCYLPLLGFLTFDDEPDQYLFSARLRPGNVHASRGAIPILRRTVAALRQAFPNAEIRVRLDGGFATPAIFDCLEELEVEFVVGMPKNDRLLKLATPWRLWAEFLSKTYDRPVQFFGNFSYQARTWPKSRRVVVKAEVTHIEGREPRENPRFVVTNSPRPSEKVYDFYRGRGEIENRIKELLHGLEIDRTSCSRFLANQFRVLQAATAYVLFQELRLRARRTELGRAQVRTLRERLLKIGAWVEESVRRILLHFPSGYPWQELWCRIARATGAGLT